MTNKRYNRGRRFEYRVKDYLIKKGYFVIRSAGSKGVADLVAIEPYYNHSKAYLIQCKYGTAKINKQEVVKLTRLADKVNAIPVLVGIDSRHSLKFMNLMTTLEMKL